MDKHACLKMEKDDVNQPSLFFQTVSYVLILFLVFVLRLDSLGLGLGLGVRVLGRVLAVMVSIVLGDFLRLVVGHAGFLGFAFGLVLPWSW